MSPRTPGPSPEPDSPDTSLSAPTSTEPATPEAESTVPTGATRVGAHRRYGPRHRAADWLRDPRGGHQSALQRVSPRMRLVQVGSAVAAAGVLAASASAFATSPQEPVVASAAFTESLPQSKIGPAPEGASEPAAKNNALEDLGAGKVAENKSPERAGGNEASKDTPSDASKKGSSDRAERKVGGPEQPKAAVDPVKSWSTQSAPSVDVPPRALQAYAEAADALREKRPDCKLPWNLLAGIGSVESHHGEIFGAELDDSGRPSTPIIGIALDGGTGVKSISDTDGGTLDGDVTTDRAVGPMQFIPTTWKTWGMDGNDDGKVDPQNLDDAAASAGNYLCGEGAARDLSSEDAQREALMEYNQSSEYGEDVLDAAARYGQAGGPQSERG